MCYYVGCSRRSVSSVTVTQLEARHRCGHLEATSDRYPISCRTEALATEKEVLTVDVKARRMELRGYRG